MCICCWEFDDPDDHRNSVRKTRGCALVGLTLGLCLFVLGVILAVEFAPNYKTEKEWTVIVAAGLIVSGTVVVMMAVTLCCFVSKYLNAEWGQIRIKMIPKSKSKPAK